MKAALLILGDQLFPLSFYKKHKELPIFMAEDVGLATHYKYHKHKIAFFFLSMRSYADELSNQGFNVHYEKLSDSGFVDRLKKSRQKTKLKKLLCLKYRISSLKKN